MLSELINLFSENRNSRKCFNNPRLLTSESGCLNHIGSSLEINLYPLFFSLMKSGTWEHFKNKL